MKYKFDDLQGRDFEYFLEDMYTTLGYESKVTKQTNDFGADLIIKKDNKTYAIQAKCYNTQSVNNTAVQEVTASLNYYNADIGVVVTNNYFTDNAKILASKNNIILIDRDLLVEQYTLAKTLKYPSSNLDRLSNIDIEKDSPDIKTLTNRSIQKNNWLRKSLDFCHMKLKSIPILKNKPIQKNNWLNKSLSFCLMTLEKFFLVIEDYIVNHTKLSFYFFLYLIIIIEVLTSQKSDSSIICFLVGCLHLYIGIGHVIYSIIRFIIKKENVFSLKKLMLHLLIFILWIIISIVLNGYAL